MKKTTIAYIAVGLVIGAYFVFEGQLADLFVTGFISKDLKQVKTYSLSFMEDLQFKDFTKAAKYHHPEDQENADIPKLIERIFQVKPEMLDIMEYAIMDAFLDSSKARARVKLKAKVHLLNTDKIQHPEVILYYHKKNEAWFMELESSLR